MSCFDWSRIYNLHYLHLHTPNTDYFYQAQGRSRGRKDPKYQIDACSKDLYERRRHTTHTPKNEFFLDNVKSSPNQLSLL